MDLVEARAKYYSQHASEKLTLEIGETYPPVELNFHTLESQ
jgi:hypothetical protein